MSVLPSLLRSAFDKISTSQSASLPSSWLTAVIVILPGFTALILPLLSTAATVGSLLSHENLAEDEFPVLKDAVKLAVSPWFKTKLLLLSLTKESCPIYIVLLARVCTVPLILAFITAVPFVEFAGINSWPDWESIFTPGKFVFIDH